MHIKGFSNIFFLMLLVFFTACTKNTEDYQPPTKGNIPPSYFIETTWKVMENTISIPDTINDYCIRNVKSIWFGSDKCIVTAENNALTMDKKRDYIGYYSLENDPDRSITYMYLKNLTNGKDTCTYKLMVDELNANRSSVSLVLDLCSGNRLKESNYGSFRLSK